MMIKAMNRVLVTGGAGFLGSNLCCRLVDVGYDVLCVDNLCTGAKANISGLMDCDKFEFMRHDITFPLYVEVDEIYNLACPASPVHYQSDPVRTVKTNVHGSINVLGLAKRLGIKIFQASTSEVYGDPAVHPQVETYFGNVNPIGVRSCYDEGKRCAETLFFDYWRQYGLDVKVARIFNTYGPRMQRDDGRVISNFVVSALLGQPIVVYGDGSQTRSFCYVDDMVEAIILFMASKDALRSDFFTPYLVNIGNPVEYRIIDVAEEVLRITGSKSEVVFAELPKDDPVMRKPDISLMNKLTGWWPKIDLADGLRKTVEYFDGMLIRGGC